MPLLPKAMTHMGFRVLTQTLNPGVSEEPRFCAQGTNLGNTIRVRQK
jgi:hypothetical protein